MSTVHKRHLQETVKHKTISRQKLLKRLFDAKKSGSKRRLYGRRKSHLERLVAGSRITVASDTSPNRLKYSFKPSVQRK